jgi:hypothetical protein
MSELTHPPKSRDFLWAILGALVLVFLGMYLLGPGGRDDVYKTLWPAEAFATSGRIVNYNGDAVEQSSSLLHVLALGGARTVLGGSLANINLALTIFCGALGIWLAIKLARQLGLRANAWLALALGTQGCWAYWAMGGLDGVISGVCWLFWLRMLIFCVEDSRALRLILPTILLVLVRPENGLIAIGAIIFYLSWDVLKAPQAFSRLNIKRIGTVLLIVALAMAALIGWRIWHGGAWLPQSALAKSDGLSLRRMRSGLGYLFLETYRHPELIPLWLGMGLASWRILRKRSLPAGTRLLFCTVAVGLIFIVASGGDWMENSRFLVPFILPFVLQMWLEIEQFARKIQLLIRIGYVTANLAGLLWIAAHFNIGYPPFSAPLMAKTESASAAPFAERYNKVHLRDMRPLEELLQIHDRIYQQKGTQVHILSQQAGYMMYHLSLERPRQFHFVDLVSLCTPDFTNCPVTRARGRMRGGLNMDLMYMLTDWENIAQQCSMEKPDIIFGLDEDDLRLTKFLQAHGYAIAALQEGWMANASFLSPGLQISATEFIVVQEKWASLFEPMGWQIRSK